MSVQKTQSDAPSLECAMGAMGASPIAATAAAIAGWLVPRGPVTTPEAAIALVVAIVVGFAASWVMRSRWALVLVPSFSWSRSSSHACASEIGCRL